METLPVPPGRPKHLDAYPSSCVLRLSVESGEMAMPLARLGGGEGIITMAADFARSRIFCLSWPSAWLCIVGKDQERLQAGLCYTSSITRAVAMKRASIRAPAATVPFADPWL